MKYLILIGLIGLFFTSYLPAVSSAGYILPTSPKMAIEARFGTTSPMVAISICESGLRQYTASGEVLISKTGDHGLFQINQIHLVEAAKLGMDIDTLQGNIDFAALLYQKNHLKDWENSRPCWSKLTADV